MVYQWINGLTQQLQSHLQCKCLLCTKPLSQKEKSLPIFGLCTHCYRQLPHQQESCSHCDLALEAHDLGNSNKICGQCLQHAPHFNKAHCPLRYTRNNHEMINHIKHHHTAYTHLGSSLICHYLPKTAHIDLIIPIPMHYKKWLRRGNNHCHLLAKAISQQTGIPYSQRYLHLNRATQDQKTLGAKSRKRNLHQAFNVQKSCAGLHIALVDDVITSGATMNEAALTLKQAGAAYVEAWAIARTEKFHF